MSLEAKFDVGLSRKGLKMKSPNLQGSHLVSNQLLTSSVKLSSIKAKKTTDSWMLSHTASLTSKQHLSKTTVTASQLRVPAVDLTNKLLTTSESTKQTVTKQFLGCTMSDGRAKIGGESLLPKYQMKTSGLLTTTGPLQLHVAKESSNLPVTTHSNGICSTGLSKPKPKRSLQPELKQKLHKTEKAVKKKHTGKLIKSKTLAKTIVLDRDAILDKYSVKKHSFYDLATSTLPTELEIPKFIPPEKDATIQKLLRPVHDVMAVKRVLINAVSASLIRAPDFKECHNPVRVDLIQIADRVAIYDPEFVLKVALYTRNELNIRTTGNFLLTYAAHHRVCRSFLRKYFCASVRLPSDWIEVAEQYQTFRDSSLNKGSLPTALRRVMAQKFPQFDNYQLAKYNKENAMKKKRKNANKNKVTDEQGGQSNTECRLSQRQELGVEQFQEARTSDLSECETDEEEIIRQSFTLKQLIRKLHITEPVEAVMCLIGKRYPSNMEEFYQSRLPGTFDPDRANKRMKLPTPETWETQVSLKGNKASTWEDLIDHKKLPYMAMLRNLRNMIRAGISEKHHTWVLKKLADEGAVVNSRQFPFRFFSAYEVLRQLDEELTVIQANALSQKSKKPDRRQTCARGRGRGRGQGRGRRQGREKTQGNEPQELQYDADLLKRYKKALDSAVKIATVHNVKPIRGTTYVFCNLGNSMARPCTSARGLGKQVTVLQVGALLGLMCKYSCEESTMIAYGTSDHRQVELEKGTILDNMKSVTDLVPILNSAEGRAELPVSLLHDLLVDQTQIDNLIILSDGMTLNSSEGKAVTGFLKKYRRMVNADLLFVSVDLSGSSSGFDKHIQPGHDNDIYLAGYSDQILRFIAERGDDGQLIHVENIDIAYNLETVSKHQSDVSVVKNKKTKFDHPLTLVSQTPRWRTARVFISSTFRDMHGERDLLTRYVFPELRAFARRHFINVHEVDLRWGVTEEVTRSNKTLELCLEELSHCQFFVGLLGERYGWVPNEYCIPDKPEFEWISEYPKGASVTELEMYHAALRKPEEAKRHAFFYIRSSEGYEFIPDELKEDFVSVDPEARQRLDQLKKKIRSSGLKVYNNYPWHWGGVVDNKPVAEGLSAFGEDVLESLLDAILKTYPDEAALVDDVTHETGQHDAYMQSHYETFTGRKKLIKKVLNHLQNNSSPVIGIVGKPGSGKSALMAAVIHEYVESEHCESGLNIFTHFVGAVPGSTHIVGMLRRLCHEMIRRFSLESEVPEGYKNLVVKFSELLGQSAKQCHTPIVVFLDALELLDDDYQNLEWIQDTLPQNVIFVLSTKEDAAPYKAITRRSDATIINIGTLELLERADVIRKMLSVHRKALDESPFNNQMKILASKKEANSPLYLSVACEELRVFGLYDQLMPKLKSMPHTIPLLLQDVLGRLEKDFGHQLVSTALALIACARNGLEETELYDLLNYYQLLNNSSFNIHDICNIKLDVDKKVAPITLAQLFRAIQGFLRPAGAQRCHHLAITHSDVRQVVHHRYIKMAGIDYEMKLHKLVAGYYYQLADPLGSGVWDGTCPKAFSELPYHLASGGLFKELEDVLCNLYFIYRKARFGMVTQLLEDYQAKGSSSKINKSQQKFLSTKRVMEYQNFVSRNAHVMKSHPSLTWQQALNEVSQTSPARDVRHLMTDTNFTTDLAVIEWTNKPASSDPCLYTLNDLPQVVSCVAVCPDNQLLACGTQDCTVKVYDLETGKEKSSFVGHSGQITGVCFVGSQRLCSASADNTLSLWNVTECFRIAVLEGHKRKVNAVVCDPAGKQLASAGWDCKIRIWNANTGKIDSQLSEGHPINCVCYHPEGQLIATGSWDAAIRIWDTFHKRCRAVIRGHLTSVRDVAFSPSGNHIVSAAIDGEVKLWSAVNGTQIGNFTGHALPINKLCFTPSGHQVVTVSDDHKVKVWSGHMGKSLSVIMPSSEEETEIKDAAMAVAFNPNGESIAVGYHEGHVRVYDILSGIVKYERQYHKESVRTIRYNREGSDIVCGSDDNTLTVFDANNATKLASLTGHTKPVICVVYGRHYIVSTSHDFMAHVYPLRFHFNKRLNIIKPLYVLAGHNGPVTCCSFNNDETMLVTGSRDMSLRIWKVHELNPGENSQPAMLIEHCHSDWINSCVWSNTGDYIVTASNDFNIKIWDVKTGNEKVKIRGHESAINQLAYKYGCIVSCSADGLLKVWSHKGTEITTLYGHTQRVNSCDILVKMKPNRVKPTETCDWATMADDENWLEKHSDKKLNKNEVKIEEVLVVSASDDGTVRLWKPLEANELACYTGHTHKVLAVSCTSNGKICTSARDKCIKLWHSLLEVDAQDNVIPSHDAEVTAISCTLSGDTIYTGCRNGYLMMWKCEEDYGKPIVYVMVKAHDKSIGGITVACESHETHFVITGSHDGHMTSWKLITTQKNKKVLRKLESTATNKPITGVNCIRGTDRLVVTDWSTKITVWQLATNTGKLSSVQVLESPHVDWVIASAVFTQDDSFAVVTCGMDEKAVLYFAKYKQGGDIEEVKEFHTEHITYSGNDRLPKEKRYANWITCVAISDNTLWFGDIHGQISCDLYKKQLHAGAVTACVIVENTLVTASRDLTIKLWHTESLVQIGQYFCTSPVLSMKAVQHDSAVYLYCGDQLGRLTVFCWKA